MRSGRPVEVAPGVVIAVGATAGVLARTAPDPADRASAAGLPPWRAEERVAARTLLRRLLAEVCGGTVARAALAAEPGGRPVLPGYPGIGISLSHDAGAVAAAVGLAHRVGVDVQGRVPVSAALLRRCCAPEVAARIAAMPAPRGAAAFAAVWAVQEACVKAAGTGLAGRPWTVPVGYRHRHGTWQAYRWRLYTPAARPPVACAYAPDPGA
jgi:4'-phosphopantetheinyl transferase